MKRSTPDLSWVEPFVERIRPYVSVRLEDNVLIRMPNECFKLNPTGARLLHYMLNGGKLKKLLKIRANDAQTPDQIHEFFTALSLMLGANFCEQFHSPAVTRVGYTLGYIELPVLAELAITDRCNIRCRFCYASCQKDSSDQVTEMSVKECKQILRVIRHDAGVPSVSFTGGEPMLRPEIFELIEYAHKSLKMRVNLITNGTLITADAARKLRKSGLASAQVSLESPDPETHDRLTCVKGSHRLSVNGMMALKKAGIYVHPHSTLCAENAASLINMADYVKTLGLDRFSMNMLIPVGRGKEEALAVRYHQIDELLKPIGESARNAGVEFMWYAPTPVCLFNPLAHQLGNKCCAACEGLLAIDPQGNLLPCSSWKEPVGSLLKEDFKTLWFGERAKWLRQKSAAPPECDGCVDFALCNGACPLYFNVFPEDRALLNCQKNFVDKTEESHDIPVKNSRISIS